jgi:hypothetical protein
MRGLATAAVVTAFACFGVTFGSPGKALAKDTQEFTSGQWTGYSYTDDSTGQFTDCTAWVANSDEVQVGVSVLKDRTLKFWLYSKGWNLPLNQTYPVSFWIDRNAEYHGKVATASAQSASVKIDAAQAVYDQLQQGTQLTLRTNAGDYVFALTGSRAALTRLLSCVDQYAKAGVTNPFGGGSTDNQQNNSQTDNSQQNTTQQNNQQNNSQQNGTQSGDQQASNSNSTTTMKTLTLSVQQVHDFLTDVTGAKPSMITATAKADKQGSPYYTFSTPLGGGEFWQEGLGKDKLADIASGYLSDYKKDCKGDFEQNPGDPVQGQHGEMVAGTASCSNSPYQSNGPEFLSYTMSDSDQVVSIYLTYTGGNAAKAKLDALGKLIAKRTGELVQ